MDTVAFGRGFKTLRLRRHLRQADLADQAEVSRSAIARIEQGRADRVTVETLEKVARPLGARVLCRLTWNGEGLDRLLDANHAEIVERVVRMLAAAGWLVATEVSFNVWGERGAIDVLAFHARTRILLVVEVKSVVPDVQATLTTLDRKERLGLEVARTRGWDDTTVAKLLVVKNDRTSRRRIEQHAATFGNAFPDRARQIRTWLAAPDPRRRLRGLWSLSNESHTVARQRVRAHPRPPERDNGERS